MMKYLSIFLILIAVSVSAQTMTDDIPELIARQQYAFNFDFGFGMGGGGGGIPSTAILAETGSPLLTETGVNLLLE